LESGFVELEGFFSFAQHDVLNVGGHESETDTDSQEDETSREGGEHGDGARDEGEEDVGTSSASLSKDEEGGDLDASILLFEGSKSDGLELEEEGEGEEEGDTSQSDKGDTIEEGVVVSIDPGAVNVLGALEDGVTHIIETVSQVVQGITDVADQEDNDTVVIVLEPSVVELFFEGGVVEVGVSGGRSFTGKSLEIHLGINEKCLGLILFLLIIRFPSAFIAYSPSNKFMYNQQLFLSINLSDIAKTQRCFPKPVFYYKT